MTSELKVDKVSPATGTSTTLGDSGDTFTVPSGVTLDTSSSTLSLPSSVITGQTEKTSLVDADKFLVSDSAASGALKYVQKSNLGAGGLVYVGGSESTSATSVVSVDNVFSSTYTNYLVVVSRIIPTTGGTDVFFKFRSSAPADVSGNYGYAGRFLIANTGAESSKNGDSQDGVQINNGDDAGINNNTTGEGFRMTLNVLNPVGSVQTGYHGTMAMLDNNGYGEGGYIGGIHQANSSIAGITFYMSTGTIARHTIKVYGMVDS